MSIISKPIYSSLYFLSDNAKEEGQGIVTWFKSRFRRVPVAYLGEKNTYRFNEATGKWEFDVDLTEVNQNDVDGEGLEDLPLTSRYDNSEGIQDESTGSNSHGNSKDTANASGRLIKVGDSNTSDDVLEDGSRYMKGSQYVNGVDISSAHPVRFGKKDKLSKEQLEEHGLVLAIQAAHLASTFNKRDIYQSKSGNYSSLSSARSPYQSFDDSSMMTAANELFMSQGSNWEGMTELGMYPSSCLDNMDRISSNSVNENSSSSAINVKLSSHIFLIVITIYLLISSVQTLLLTLLPVWLAGPLRNGGLMYGVFELGMMMSISGIFLYLAHIFLAAKFNHILKSSPVRALRIGCGVLLIAMFAFPCYTRCYILPPEDVLHHAYEGFGDKFQVKTAQKDILEAIHGFMLTSDGSLNPQTVLTQWPRVLPSMLRSPQTIILTSFFVSIIVSAAYLCRKAAGLLLHLALSTSFSSPTTVRYAVNVVADVCGPFLATLLYSSVCSFRLRYPMDGSFFLSLSACLIVPAYIASLMLVVQFRGDYGIMTDQDEFQVVSPLTSSFGGASTSSIAQSVSALPSYLNYSSMMSGSGSNTFHRSVHQRHNPLSSGWKSESTKDFRAGAVDAGFSSSQSISSSSSYHNEENILTIPLCDINLLFSPIGSGYGSKLYNLKDDFKDL